MKNRIEKLNDLPPTLFFDGVCNLCNSSVAFILRNERDDQLRFASLQSDIARRVIPEDAFSGEPSGDTGSKSAGSLVLVTDGSVLRKSEAVVAIARHLRFPSRAITITRILPRFLRDRLYDLVARHRYQWFGRLETCMIPDPDVAERFYD